MKETIEKQREFFASGKTLDLKFRLEQLEKKVEKHNNLVERMQAVEDRAKSNTHRIDTWEGNYGADSKISSI